MGFLKMERHFLDSHDGCRIAYYSHGTGSTTLVLAPGLGTPPEAYHFLIEHFSPRYRCITWSLRGSFDSARPPNKTSLRIADHVADLEAIVKKEQLPHLLLGGWSLGVMIALQYAIEHPHDIDALLLINGTYGFPTRFRDPLRKLLLTLTPPIIRRSHRPLRHLLQRSFSLQRAWRWGVRASGFVAANHHAFVDLAQIYTSQPLDNLVDLIEAAAEHDTSPFLPQLFIPALVTAGTKDWMTPPSRAKRLASLLPKAQYLEIPGGTHYTPLEFPEPIHRTFDDLLEKYPPRS